MPFMLAYSCVTFHFLLGSSDLYMCYTCSVLFSRKPLRQEPKESAISVIFINSSNCLEVTQFKYSSVSRNLKCILDFQGESPLNSSRSGTHRNAIFRA